jgi:NAD(P)-dependent dehydrogenase (short-subunit alcohol dehydrogenase family)
MLRVDVQTREGDSLISEPKSTILITGTSGRIGYPLARRLAQSFNVVGFDRRAPSHPPPSAECLYVDLTIDESLQRGLHAIRELHGNRLACVIHLAAYYDFSGAPSPLYDRITVGGTERRCAFSRISKSSNLSFRAANWCMHRLNRVNASTKMHHSPPGGPTRSQRSRRSG